MSEVWEEIPVAVHAPLSFSQESLWLTEEIVPGLSQYQMVMVFELRGALDRALLERSVARIVDRHELLRSRFTRVDGVPVLETGDPPPVVLGFVDLSTVPPGPAADAALRALVARWYEEPFDLSRPPLLRSEVVRLDGDRHVLILATHHIVGDEVSLSVIQRELFACYAAFTAGAEPELPELPLQYGDFTAWQREEVELDLAAGLTYWAERLADLPTVELPVEAPRGGVRAFTCAYLDVDVDAATMAGLLALARDRDTSVFTVLLAAYDLLLSRWSGSADVVVGTPVAGRPEPELENLIGFFVNSVVLRARCVPDEPFTALLDRVKRDLAEDLAADHVPFHRIVERVNPARDRSRHPLFQTAFHWEALEDDGETGTMADLAVVDRTQEFLRSCRVTTEFDLVVQVIVTPVGSRVQFRYAAELFGQDSIADLADQYTRLLTSIVADPEAAPRLPGFRPTGAPPLPAPLAPRPPSGTAPRPLVPSTDVTPEQVLAVLAAELGGPALTLQDDFFEVGGSSLIGARAVQRLRDELGLPVTLIDLFDAESLGELVQMCGITLDDVPNGAPEAPEVPADAAPASYAVSRLWSRYQRAGDAAGLHHTPNALRLTGTLDEEALRAALTDVAHRHEPLRTVLRERDGTVYRVVLAPEQAAPALETATVHPDDLDRVATAAAAASFDLVRDVPWRAHLYDTGDGWLLLIVIHDVATDAWSTWPLLHDLTTAYTARASGKEPSWLPLAAGYGDFAAAHPELFGSGAWQDDRLAPQLAYWTEQLAGLPAAITLPTTGLRTNRTGRRGASVAFDFPNDVYRALARLAGRHRGTVVMVLQAGIAALLTGYGAGTDIPLGCAVAGRTDRALDDAVGAFSNRLVLRVGTDGDPAFEELLRAVRRMSLTAFGHQDVPFCRLAEELRPGHEGPEHPLFQVFLSICTAPVLPADLEMPQLRAELAEAATGLTPYDLSFEFTELHTPEGGELYCRIEYAAELFDAAAVRRIVDDVLALFTAVAADPGSPLSRLLSGGA